MWALLVLLFIFILSLSIGRYRVPFGETVRILLGNLFPVDKTWSDKMQAAVMTLRFPRSLTAIIVGAGLALSGASYQSIFKNPMCSPDLLGVSSGACIGAAVGILLNGNSVMIQLLAFATGIAAVALTTSIPRLIHNQSTTILILSGVVVSSLLSSVMSAIKYIADTDTQLAEITYWTMGSFATVTMKQLIPVAIPILLCMIMMLMMRYRLNVLSLGDQEARSLGIDIQKTRGLFVLFSTLITSCCVCISGTVGWVGLIIPHTARMVIGADNKRMLPVCMVFGAIFMLLIDMACRTLTAAELRLGILTGLIGAPFFIFILVKQHRSLT